MLHIVVGILLLELILLIFIKKTRKYIFSMIILDITTILVYFLLVSIILRYESDLFIIDKIAIFIFSLSISLLIDTVFVVFLQRSHERKIIHSYEKKYQSDNFEYYRDILKEQSPGILYVCYNTRKRNFKDLIVSILLHLKQTKIIDIENDNIKIIGDISKIEDHEKILLDYIECKYERKTFKRKFYKSLVEDLKAKNYIFTENEDRMDMTMFSQFVIVIMILLLLTYFFSASFAGPLLKEFSVQSKYGGFIFIAYFLFFVSIPIYQWIESNINAIVRTESGLELCGKLKGLKHFLEDFSKLGSTETKQIGLYDEYMIYSILLNIKGKINKESNYLYDKFMEFPKLALNSKIRRKNYRIEGVNKNVFPILLFILFPWILFFVSLILEQAYFAAYIVLVPIVVSLFIGIIVFRKKQKFKKRRDVIITYGIKLPGMIIGRKVNDDDHYVMVRFSYEGRTYECKTPNVNFSMFDIENDTVSVYYFKGYCYVDHFVLKEHSKGK